MCETCGCSIPGHEHPEPADTHTVEVLKGLMSSNDHAAAHNREHFDRSGVLVVNLMSSPGAGKTRLLEQTAAGLGGRLNIAVIEGDLETENDAERLRRGGIRAHQITTGSACHLPSAHRALPRAVAPPATDQHCYTACPNQGKTPNRTPHQHRTLLHQTPPQSRDFHHPRCCRCNCCSLLAHVSGGPAAPGTYTHPATTPPTRAAVAHPRRCQLQTQIKPNTASNDLCSAGAH